jgi:DNA repair exonuclease SbcCD nuclease subunit
MNKIIFLGDTHFALRNSNIEHHEHMALFFKDFFAFIDKTNIKYVVQTGDLFDVRKSINVWAINQFRTMFLDEITKRRIKLYVLVGNHDIYYRESVKINTIREMLTDYQLLNPDILTLVDEPMHINLAGEKFLICPWVCKENEGTIDNIIKSSDAKYCVGHFEFNGFEMQKGQTIKTKWDHKQYEKFDLVISGHYHHKSRKDNILYVGTPYQITWADYNDDKGFWVFDSGKMHFCKNRHNIFNRIEYSEEVIPEESKVKNKYIQVIVKERPDKKKFNAFLDSLHLLSPYDVKVREMFSEEMSTEVIQHDVKNTESIIKEFIENSVIELDKEKMLQIMNDLYREVNKN